MSPTRFFSAPKKRGKAQLAGLPSEASGRQAVQLNSQGQYVEFTLSAPANSITVRYSLQDGKSGSLSLYANGSKLGGQLAMTSKYSYIDTPWIPGAKTHKFYDSRYAAIQFIDGNGHGKAIQGVSINGGSIQGAGTFAIQAQTTGSVNISNVTASGIGVAGTYNCPYPTTISPLAIGGSGNSGISGTWTNCATWPPPNSGPPTPPGSGSNAALSRPVTSSSAVGGTYSTIVGSRGFTFDPASGNTATVTFGTTGQRYLRLNITGNTGWPAGQVSEFEVFRA